MMRIVENELQVRSNLKLIARERGKMVARREGHNIWVNIGREFLAGLICYASYAGYVGTPERNDRVQFMGLGIGGNRQNALALANSSPLGGATPPNHYSGSNAQTDTDPTLQYLERPVRVSWSGPTPTASPYDPVDDEWYAQVGPVTGITGHPTAYETRFTTLIGETQINGSTSYYPSVPLSEVGLFTGAINRHLPSSVTNPSNVYLAYDTFDTISKTVGVTFEIEWTIRF
jgi:hypothetical protein